MQSRVFIYLLHFMPIFPAKNEIIDLFLYRCPWLFFFFKSKMWVIHPFQVLLLSKTFFVIHQPKSYFLSSQHLRIYVHIIQVQKISCFITSILYMGNNFKCTHGFLCLDVSHCPLCYFPLSEKRKKVFSTFKFHRLSLPFPPTGFHVGRCFSYLVFEQ